MKDILVKTNDELAHDIVNYFFHAGETVSKADYDFVLNVLTQKDAEVATERERIVELIKKATTHDHSKCPIKETCIGYQSCVSDIENGVISLITNKGDTNN